ncbi:MAG: hypothetical protein U0802_09065 [Candidatus Binatia bacterium]
MVGVHRVDDHLHDRPGRRVDRGGRADQRGPPVARRGGLGYSVGHGGGTPSHGRRGASGSLLLFGTNYVAILLTGALVFGVMGFRTAALSPFDPRARRQAVAIAVAALLIIAVPLSATSYRLVMTNMIAARSYALGQEWLRGSGYRLMSVDAETADGTVEFLLMGSGDLPPLETLQERARGVLLDRTLRVKVVESRTLTLGSQSP